MLEDAKSECVGNQLTVKSYPVELELHRDARDHRFSPAFMVPARI